jgi:DNA-binding NtrC family response regulator
MAAILVVDDEMGIRELLSEILLDEGHDVVLAENAASARAARARARPDLVLLDIWMPDVDGITLLKEWASGGQLTMPVIMMSGHGSIETAVEATRIGAIDYLEKPIALQKLLSAVKRGLQATPRERNVHLSLDAFGRIAPLKDLKKQIEQIFERSRMILLRDAGSSLGEVCARSLHAPGKPWLDLSQLNTPLEVPTLESLAGGVLFVDDLSALAGLQQKNLWFACERLDKYNLRLVVCAEGPLQSFLGKGLDERTLRRLFEVSLALPGLAELKDEVPEIAGYLLNHLIEAGEVPHRRLSTAALNALRLRGWPGGYDELKRAIKSLALGALNEDISAEEVTRLLPSQPTRVHELPLELPLREAREAFERLYFEHHLGRDGGNMTRLAERTGLERTHLYRKLKQLGLPAGRRGECEVV